jgi:hypothetical protein
VSWTPEQIAALAPDASSLKAAKALTSPAKWPLLGQSEGALWGHCQGSGKTPYQVRIDRDGPAFKCSCPSRKFPCKHGLALLFLATQQGDRFVAGPPPDWVRDWLDSRQERAAKKATKPSTAAQAEPAASADPAAAARREEQRWESILAVVDETERWLHDSVGHGLATLQKEPAASWRRLQARTVDGKAAGLAHWIHRIERATFAGAEWAERMLAEMGRLQLLLTSVRRYADLPPDLQADLRSLLGWAIDKETVLREGARVTDLWRVAGVAFEENERLFERRVWVQGLESGRTALLLDFAHGSRRFEPAIIAPSAFRGELVFYPGRAGLRALPGDQLAWQAAPSPPPVQSLEQALEGITDLVAVHPWATRVPFAWSGCTPVSTRGALRFADHAGRSLPAQLETEATWQLLALSGGHPVDLFAEWDGEALRPLAAIAPDGIWVAPS